MRYNVTPVNNKLTQFFICPSPVQLVSLDTAAPSAAGFVDEIEVIDDNERWHEKRPVRILHNQLIPLEFPNLV